MRGVMAMMLVVGCGEGKEEERRRGHGGDMILLVVAQPPSVQVCGQSERGGVLICTPCLLGNSVSS